MLKSLVIRNDVEIQYIALGSFSSYHKPESSALPFHLRCWIVNSRSAFSQVLDSAPSPGRQNVFQMSTSGGARVQLIEQLIWWNKSSGLISADSFPFLCCMCVCLTVHLSILLGLLPFHFSLFAQQMFHLSAAPRQIRIPLNFSCRFLSSFYQLPSLPFAAFATPSSFWCALNERTLTQHYPCRKTRNLLQRMLRARAHYLPPIEGHNRSYSCMFHLLLPD